jgi:hypothetical protein
MARLSDMTAAGRSDVLPGYVLSPPRLREWGEAEAEAGRCAVRVARALAEELPADRQREVLATAYEEVTSGAYSMGMPKLDAFLRAAANAPFIQWLCLRVKHPQVGRADMPTIVTEDVEEDVQRASLELWGFLPPLKKRTARAGRQNPSPPTGRESSPPAENAA